ncbi:sugar phosphate isomerase/epimerase and 4-hydroxyphenylpyruvate domain-containing protein [Micrococcales bacterium 31B]|nr:sugar phosphate isomerase/epimerase and 4-hydroxyphenylpyruvate domain-containing protein [Micrococcales bacterium 31B]
MSATTLSATTLSAAPAARAPLAAAGLATSIATVCLGGTLPEKLEAIAAAGFDGVEIFELDLLACPLTPAEVRERCSELGLRIDMFQPLRDVEGVTDEVFAATLRRASHKFELMRELGTDLVLVCSNVATATLDDDALAARQLGALADLAAEYGIRIAYEALAWGRYVNTVAHSWRLVALADRDNLGLCVDSFHILSREANGAGFQGVPGHKIFFCQLADAPTMHLDVLSWSRHYRVFPGEGDFDLADFVRRLAATGYAGPLSLEIFNDVFRQIDPRRGAVDAHRSLTALAEGAGLAALAPPQTPTALTFVEVATRGSEDFADLLQGLGFTYLGRHRRKNVHLWSQGEARVIVNLESGAASGTPLLRGFGVAVPDAIAAASRAADLGISLLPRETADGEAPLLGVLAPDHSEVYFESHGGADWAQEFEPTHRTSQVATPLGLTHLDHFSVGQPFEHLDEAVLFHRALLGLTREAQVDVADPHGLVRSHALRSENGAVRLALNLAPERLAGTHTPQHIAFAVADAVAAARQARANGLDLLDVPGNYYADLDARLGDSPRLKALGLTVGDLRDLNLFYDEDAHGAFLHFYTHIVGHVGFEVVQRVGAYAGYGAPNAPIRRAAQYLASAPQTPTEI